MQVKKISRQQYARLADQAADQIGTSNVPPEGWLASIRKAIGMSGPQLAKRLKLTKAAIYQAERKELEGAISIKQLQKLAKEMNCRLVYAIVPNKSVEQIIFEQAELKAKEIVDAASTHMALEKQSLSKTQIEQEVNRIANEIANNMPADLWEQT